MSGSSQNVGRSRWAIGTVVVVAALWVGGLGSVLAQTDTEHEAERVLDVLQIEPGPEPNIPMPDVYDTPPKIVEQMVGGAPEFKLFYFCKQHTSDELKKIVHEQFATKVFDAKGKLTRVPDYTVSSNPATNQLIVRCPHREDVDAVLELLEEVDVAPVQVKIDCLISDIFADMTFDRETTLAIENLMTPGGMPFGANVQQLVLDDDFFPAFPGASFREVMRSRMGLAVGYFRDSGHFTALVDLLESRGYLKILMNPTLEVVNGKPATITITQHVPLQTITKVAPGRGSTGGAGLVITTEIEYIDVIDSLEITPHVFADGYIGLETSILIGARNTPDGVKQIPIVTKKEIENKENRIRQGESLIIGGIRKTMEFGVVRGFPILKDLPLIGFLFSSEDTEERAVETVFILTPTISTGGRPREEVMAEVKRKHEADSAKGLGEMITDPFGSKDREQARRREALDAERLRLEANAEKAEARSAVRAATERAERAEAELKRLQTETERIEADAEEAIAQAEAKVKAAEAAKVAAEKAAADEAKPKAQQPKENSGRPRSGAGRPATKEAEAEKPKANKDEAVAKEG